LAGEKNEAIRNGRWFAGQRAYVIGLSLLVLATGWGLALDPHGQTKSPMLLLLGAVMTAAWFGGLATGLTATLRAALVGDYLFVPGPSSLAPGHAGVNLGLILLGGGCISALASRLRATGRRETTQRVNPLDAAERRTPPGRLEPEFETIERLGLALAGQLERGKLVQAINEAGVAITGAA
jgi:K+-sensing histidine kinase KdpD